MQHNHSVYDTDTHFVIDPVTRAITNVNAKKNTLIQFDHNSEVFDFEIPRFVDGHDMLQCNEVKVHYINIDAKSSDKKNKGTYEVKDYGVLESNPNTAVFSWLISDNATQLVGVLNFLITFCCTENGVVVYRWSTGICQTVSVSSGMTMAKRSLWNTRTFSLSGKRNCLKLAAMRLSMSPRQKQTHLLQSKRREKQRKRLCLQVFLMNTKHCLFLLIRTTGTKLVQLLWKQTAKSLLSMMRLNIPCRI